jgi:hypothetical protein
VIRFKCCAASLSRVVTDVVIGDGNCETAMFVIVDDRFAGGLGLLDDVVRAWWMRREW